MIKTSTLPLFFVCLGTPLVLLMGSSTVEAQSVIPASDGTGTLITPITHPGGSPIQMNITGGKVSGDGANLFHSFQQFNIPQNQVVNFIATPSIQNILARINGGSPSFIDGLIQVTGGNANLFLMNPSGMIFGSQARLDVPAAFLATTADGIGFNSGGWFNAIGNADWSQLVGNPNAFAFNASQPGSIINIGQLEVGTGQPLTLLAGTIINTGSLQGGTILLQTVPGENLVRLSQTGYLLSLEISPNPDTTPSDLSPLSLPQLLTGSGIKEATNLNINQAGEIVLTQGKQVQPGDIVLLNTVATAENIFLNANNNLTLIESQFLTTADLNLLAGNTVTIRDGQTPFQAFSGGNLTIQGNQNIDILALNFPQIPLQAGGNLTLISDGIISGDAHFAAGGNFQILNLSGTVGTFFSLYDPIIYADGSVIFGDYSGASLKIEAQGSIQGGDINITQADTTLSTSNDSEFEILSSSPSLILRSGQTVTNSNLQGNTTLGNTFFINSNQNLGNNISVGNITTAGGPVILKSPGEIVVDSINSSGGNINLESNGNLLISGTLLSGGGNISIDTNNLFRVQGTVTDSTGTNVSISSAGESQDGNIVIEHGGGTEIPFIIGDATQNGTAKSITTGSETLQTTFEVPVPPARFTQGNITIITNYTPPPAPAVPLPPLTPEFPVRPPYQPPYQSPSQPPYQSPSQSPYQPPSQPTSQDQKIEHPSQEEKNEQAIQTLLQPAPRVLTQSNSGVQNAVTTQNQQLLAIEPSIDGTIENQLSDDGSGFIVTMNANNQVTIKKRSVNNSSNAETSSVNNSSSAETSSVNNSSSAETSSVNNSSNAETSSVNNSSNAETSSVNNSSSAETSSVNNSSITETSIQNLRLGINQSFDSDNVETAISQIEELVNLEYLNYLGKPASITQLTVKEIQNTLRSMQAQTGKKSAVIYVYSRPEGLEMVAVTGDTLVHKTIPEAIPKKLLATTREFIGEITSPRKRNTTSYLPPAQQLYQWMIAPIEATLKANKVDILMLTLDSGLRSLPLAALHDGKQFLIEKYALSMIPSFSSLDTRYRSISQADVLAMGASIFQEESFLPSVPVEVETIAEQRAQGKYFLNEEFTLENLKHQYQVQPSPIVHLATHADFRRGRPANSYIQLWDTKLTLDQMEQMGWSHPTADLLTLSACKTAIGDDQAELGFAGLAIASGAKSALASLWYISDAGTLGLMTEFYHHLTETTTKAEALQKAQVSLLRGTAIFEPEHLFLSEEKIEVPLPPELRNLDDFSLVHPYYWASFTLIGSPW